MELWIRSQNKRYLIKTEYLYAVYSEDSKKAYIGDKLAGYIGEYKTLKRALEILDEIHNILQPRVYIEQPDIELKPDELIMNLSQNVMMHVNDKVELELKNVGQIVYQMPKE